jgi:hypothetical protein
MHRALQSRLYDADVREMIRHLREDHAGMNQHEIDLCLTVADRIERQLHNKLGPGPTEGPKP